MSTFAIADATEKRQRAARKRARDIIARRKKASFIITRFLREAKTKIDKR